MVTTIDQGLSYIQYEADGVAVNFMLTFPYLDQSHIHVYLDGVETIGFTWLNASEITMDTAPANLVLLTVKRLTQQNERIVDFQDGGVIREATLDLDSNQMFYLVQEAIDTTAFNLAIDSTTSLIDAQNNKIINVANGVSAQDAVTKFQLDAVAVNAAAAVVTANAASVTANAIAANAATALATANAAAADVATALATANAADATANAIAATANAAVATANAAVVTANAAAADATTALANAAAALAAANASQSSANTANADLATHASQTAAHGATGAVVGTTNTQTLTNKTLTSPIINTPTGIVRGDVGLGSVDNTSDATKNSASATLANKTLTSPIVNSPSIVTPSRSDIKQDTKANLDTYALTASNGQLVYATDSKTVFQVRDGVLSALTGTGGLDTVFQLIAEEAYSTWTTGNNATLLGGGVLAGAVSNDTTTQLHGVSSYKYVQAGGSLNDYMVSPAQPVDLRFRGKEVTLYFPYAYNGTDDNIEVEIYDATNAVLLATSIFIKSTSTSSNSISVLKANLIVPLTCASIRVGFHVKVLNSGKILRTDAIQMTSDTTVYANISNITEWTSYTPTFTGMGTVAVQTFYWRQVGSSIEVRGRFTQGTATAVEARISLPNSYVSSASVHATAEVCGSWARSVTSSGHGSFILIEPSVAYVTFTNDGFSGISVNALTKINGSGLGTTQDMTINFIVPVKGLTALNTNILTAPETFSTDTAPLVYAGSAAYTSATLENAPIGTFISYTVAATSNTRTQTTIAPTQTTADMNANGIRIYARPYNALSTALLPAVIEIQIGKGLKGTTLTLYKSIGKVTTGSLDVAVQSATTTTGCFHQSYNERTGILVIDAAVVPNTNTSHVFEYSDGSNANNGYVTISASKNPALTGLNINAVAARGVNTAGTSIANTGTPTLVYDATKTYDTHGALNAATGVFTAPESGYYQANWTVTFADSTYAAGNQLYTILQKNSTNYAYGNLTEIELASAQPLAYTGSAGLFLAKGDTVNLTVGNSRTAGATLLSTSAGGTHFSIHKTNVG